MTLGSHGSLAWCVLKAIKHHKTLSLLLNLPATGEGQYLLSDGTAMPGLITIDENFSKTVNYFYPVTGGVPEDIVEEIRKHVELIETMYNPLTGKIELEDDGENDNAHDPFGVDGKLRDEQ